MNAENKTEQINTKHTGKIIKTAESVNLTRIDKVLETNSDNMLSPKSEDKEVDR